MNKKRTREEIRNQEEKTRLRKQRSLNKGRIAENPAEAIDIRSTMDFINEFRFVGDDKDWNRNYGAILLRACYGTKRAGEILKGSAIKPRTTKKATGVTT